VSASPGVDPLPPRVPGGLPWLGAGPALLRDPTAFFTRARGRYGDSYLVDAFGHRLLCLFSAAGVKSLYAFPEEEASFGLATYELVMRHKLPPELVIGRRTRPHDLFGSQEVEDYLESLEEAVSRQLDELGDAGRFEAFGFARRLGHRLGLACWAGAEVASPEYLDRLIPLFDRLDTSQSFVHPSSLFWSRGTGRFRERRAMVGIQVLTAGILDRRRSEPCRGDFLERIAARWQDVAPEEQSVGIARDVMLLHMGAQSNLYAALAWTLVNLLQRPALLGRVDAGDDGLLEQCASESIRLAQRSLTLRRVMKPLELFDGERRYRVEPPLMLATMLSVNNTSAAPGLERFDPSHYDGRRLSKQVPLAARELVSTFGHGRHACPAQRFSISAIRIAIRRLLEHYAIAPRFTEAKPLRRQLGAVARAAQPCPVEYRQRA
jgi:cytochrome P450